MFTGNEVPTKLIQDFINHPANAINMHGDPQVAMDKKLAWGIEAKTVDNKVGIMRLCGIADPDIT